VYKDIIGEIDYTKACNAMTGSYATDSSYGKKLIAIIEANDLDAWDVMEEETKVVKVYISPSSQQDNVGVGNFGTEEIRMNQIADRVETELKRVGITTLRNSPSMDITQMVAASNAFGADVHLAIHSNAGGATGAEAYYYTGSAAGKKLAQAVYDNIAPMTPTGDRGVKATTELYEVWATNGIATLVEIAFHDNATDAAFIINNIQELGIEIAKGVCSYLGINFGATPQVAPQPETVAPGTVIASILYLPNGNMWTIYPPEGPYTSGQVISTEGPKADGGIYPVILGTRGDNIMLVELETFGVVAIYFDPDKGASITKKYA